MSIEKQHVGHWLGQFHMDIRDGKMTPQRFVEIEDAIIAGFPERESGWVRIEDFSGKPETAPLAWWWSESCDEMELDEVLLDEQGAICGKGGCGVDLYSHVMLAGFGRPATPDHRRRG